MKIGIYLPTHLPGVSIQEARVWARRAEELALDTLVITNHPATDATESLMVATAVATTTSRIGLLGDVTHGPGCTARAHAEHSAGLDRASGERFTSAITFPTSEVGGHGRSGADTVRSVAATLAEVHRHWRATMPTRRTMPLLVGGPAEQAAEWVAGHADGWLMRAGTPDQLVAGTARVARAWTEGGRAGCPTVAVAFHHAPGDDAAATGRRIAEYSAAGADLVLAVLATSDLTQLDVLAAAAPQHAYA